MLGKNEKRLMDYKEFICALELGREIELALNEKEYFISHNGESYTLWSESEKEYISTGRLDEILNFKFCEGLSLKESFDNFTIKCIL